MYAYLDKVYRMNGESIEAVSIVYIDEVNNNINYDIFYKSNFDNLERYIKENNYTTDFSISGGVISCSHKITAIEIPNLSLLPAEGRVEQTRIPSLYGLLSLLAKHKCGYLGLNSLDMNLISNPPSMGNIRISKSTMTVCMSRFNSEDESWKSDSLVYMENGMLHQNTFHVSIPKDISRLFVKFNLEYVSEGYINNVNCNIYKYNTNLSVCGFVDRSTFSAPVITHFAYNSDLLNTVITLLETYKNRIFPISSPTAALKKQEYFKQVDRSGVFIDLPKQGRISDFCSECIELVDVILKYNEDNNEVLPRGVVSEFIKNAGLSYKHSLCIHTLYNIVTTSKLSLDLLDNLNSAIAEYKVDYVQYCLTLYNIRVACIYNNDILPYRSVVKFPVFGSVFKGEAIVSVR